MLNKFIESIKGRKNILGNFLGEGVLNFAPFLWIVMLNRYSGSESVGVFIALSSVYAFGKAFIEFGMNNEAVAEYAAGKKNVAAEIVSGRTILLVVLVLFGGVVSFFLDEKYLLFLAVMPLFFIPTCMDWVFKASQDSLKNAQLALISFMISLLPLAFWGIELYVVLISKAIWVSVYSIGLYLIYSASLSRVGRNSDASLDLMAFTCLGWRRIKRSWSYAVSSFMVVANQNTPILLAAAWMSPLMAGYFSLFAKIYSVFLVFKYVLMISFLPRVSLVFKSSQEKAKDLVYRITLKGGIVVIALLLVCYVLKYHLIMFIGFGEDDYAAVSHVVDWFFMASFFSYLYTFLPMLLIIQSQRFLFMSSVACGLFVSASLMTSLYALDKLSPMTAAASIAISELSVLVVLIFFLRNFGEAKENECSKNY